MTTFQALKAKKKQVIGHLRKERKARQTSDKSIREFKGLLMKLPKAEYNLHLEQIRRMCMEIDSKSFPKFNTKG